MPKKSCKNTFAPKRILRVAFRPQELLLDFLGLTAADAGIYWVIAVIILGSHDGQVKRHDRRIYRVLKVHPNAIDSSIKRLVDDGRLLVTPTGNLTILGKGHRSW